MLAPLVGAEFEARCLPSGWTIGGWTGGTRRSPAAPHRSTAPGSAPARRAAPAVPWSSPATFSGAAYQNAGFADDARRRDRVVGDVRHEPDHGRAAWPAPGTPAALSSMSPLRLPVRRIRARVPDRVGHRRPLLHRRRTRPHRSHRHGLDATARQRLQLRRRRRRPAMDAAHPVAADRRGGVQRRRTCPRVGQQPLERRIGRLGRLGRHGDGERSTAALHLLSGPGATSSSRPHSARRPTSTADSGSTSPARPVGRSSAPWAPPTRCTRVRTTTARTATPTRDGARRFAHTYRIDWLADRVVFVVDGVVRAHPDVSRSPEAWARGERLRRWRRRA